MGSFGYNTDGNRFTGIGSDVFKWEGGGKAYDYCQDSFVIGWDFIINLYMSYYPDTPVSIGFNAWKPH